MEEQLPSSPVVISSPVISIPVTSPTPASQPVAAEPKKNHTTRVITVTLIVFLVLMGLSATTLFALSLVPKSPQDVLKSAANAHLKVARFSFDTSLAADSSALNSILKTNSFDAKVSGKLDYTDIDRPILELNSVLAKDLDIDFRVKEKAAFFRVNKIPTTIAFLLSSYGISASAQQLFLNQWIAMDTKPMSTEARTSLISSTPQVTVQQQIKNYLDAFNTPEILKNLTMTEEKLNGTAVYHLYFAPTSAVLDSFWERYARESSTPQTTSPKKVTKLSDSIKNFVVNIWIDKKTFLVQKSYVKFAVASTASNNYISVAGPVGVVTPQSKDTPVFISVTLSHFNEPVNVSAPSSSMTFEEVMGKIMSQMEIPKTISPTATPGIGGVKQALPRTN